MKNSVLVFFFLILQGCAIFGSPSIGHDSWVNDSINVPPDGSEIPAELLVGVNFQYKDIAIALLATESAVPLSLEQVAKFQESEFRDSDILLEEAVKKEDFKAMQREVESSAFDVGSDAQKKFLKWSDQHRNRADRLRGYNGKIKPYLVRGVSVVGSETGGFFANYSEGILWVTFEALGLYAKNLEKQPQIVYLEQDPAVIFVSISLAQ